MFKIYSVRGTLGSMLILSLNLGILIAYLVGAYLPYNIVPGVLLVFPILFLCGSLFLPDTPRFLMLKGRIEEAEKSLKFYKGCRQNTKSSEERFKIEMDKLVSYTTARQNAEDIKVTYKDFCKRELQLKNPQYVLKQFFVIRHTAGSSWHDDWLHYDVSECFQWRLTNAELREQYIQAIRFRLGPEHIGHYYDLNAVAWYVGGNVLD